MVFPAISKSGTITMRPAFLFVFLVAVTSAQAKTQTVTSLSAAPSPGTFGQAIALIATVSPQAATGKVTFYDGVALLGSATLSNGAASLTTTAIGYGKRSLTALYGGDNNYAVSLSPVLAQNAATKPGGALAPAPATNVNAFQLQPAALYDLNHDGNLDLVAIGSNGNSAGAATLWVFLGKGDGTFASAQAYLPGVSSYGVAVADIDMDGIPDLIVTVPSGVATLIGKGDGTFKSGAGFPSADNLTAVRVADINADGMADLVFLGGTSPARVEIVFGNGDGTFQTSAPVILPLADAPSDLLIADFNSDGVPDLAVASSNGNSVTVMIGMKGGTFGPPVTYTSYGALSLGVGDLNSDGKPDIVVGRVGLPTFDLLLGNGDGTFAAARTITAKAGPPQAVITSDAGSYAITVYDFDGDGLPDVVSNEGGAVSVMLGNGDGTFRPPLLFYFFGLNGALLVGDLNHDELRTSCRSAFRLPSNPILESWRLNSPWLPAPTRRPRARTIH